MDNFELEYYSAEDAQELLLRYYVPNVNIEARNRENRVTMQNITKCEQ